MIGQIRQVSDYLYENFSYSENDIARIKHSIEIDYGIVLSKIKRMEGIFLWCKNKSQGCRFELFFQGQSSQGDGYQIHFKICRMDHALESCYLSEQEIYLRDVKDELTDKKEEIYEVMQKQFLQFRTFKQPKDILIELRQRGFWNLDKFYRKFQSTGNSYSYNDSNYQIKRKIKKKLDNVIGEMRKKLIDDLMIKVQKDQPKKKRSKSRLNLTKEEKMDIIKREQKEIKNNVEDEKIQNQQDNLEEQQEYEEKSLKRKKKIKKSYQKNRRVRFLKTMNKPSSTKGKDLMVLHRMKVKFLKKLKKERDEQKNTKTIKKNQRKNQKIKNLKQINLIPSQDNNSFIIKMHITQANQTFREHQTSDSTQIHFLSSEPELV